MARINEGKTTTVAPAAKPVKAAEPEKKVEPEKKAEPVQVTLDTAKIAPVAKEAVKSAAKKTEEAAKTVVKKTEEKAKTVKKAAVKKTAEKKAEKKENVIIQYAGQELNLADVLAKVETATKSLRSVQEINIYVKPEENRAYYVAKKTKGEEVGSVEI